MKSELTSRELGGFVMHTIQQLKKKKKKEQQTKQNMNHSLFEGHKSIS